MHGVACGRRGTRRLVGLAQLLPLLLSRTCWSERVADCMQLAIEERHLQMHTSCVFAWLQAGAAAAQGVRAALRPAWTDDPFDCTAYPPTGRLRPVQTCDMDPLLLCSALHFSTRIWLCGWPHSRPPAAPPF